MSARKATARVVFGRAEEFAVEGMSIVNERQVRVDGEVVGALVGKDPAPGNPHRPTSFRFFPDDRSVLATNFDRLEEARDGIARLYPEQVG